MVNSKKFFTTVENLKQPVFIDVAKNGESVVAKEIGVINEMSNHDVLMSAENVLYAPTLRENLMCMTKLTKAGVEVIFQETQVIMKINGEIIATGKQRENLYAEINCIELKIERANASMAEAEYTDLWHLSRLDHISEGAMSTMIREETEQPDRWSVSTLTYVDRSTSCRS